jgi:hypothetical protein
MIHQSKPVLSPSTPAQDKLSRSIENLKSLGDTAEHPGVSGTEPDFDWREKTSTRENPDAVFLSSMKRTEQVAKQADENRQTPIT